MKVSVVVELWTLVDELVFALEEIDRSPERLHVHRVVTYDAQ